jgi:hypothetical protein
MNRDEAEHPAYRFSLRINKAFWQVWPYHLRHPGVIKTRPPKDAVAVQHPRGARCRHLPTAIISRGDDIVGFDNPNAYYRVKLDADSLAPHPGKSFADVDDLIAPFH